jgi:hypothetical protein
MGCAIVLSFVVATAPYTLQAQEETKPVEKAVIRLAVIPFQAVMPEDASSTVRCLICGSVNSSGSIVPGAEKIVEEIFTDKLRGLKDAEMIPSEKAAGVYQRISADSLKQPLLQIMQKVGNELHADVLAVGYVYRYRERLGYEYSTERPASVAFEIHLISVKDGSTLWRGIFDKTQKSLMEDIFQASSFFKGGAKWVTARELTKLGVDEVFKTFSGFER